MVLYLRIAMFLESVETVRSRTTISITDKTVERNARVKLSVN